MCLSSLAVLEIRNTRKWSDISDLIFLFLYQFLDNCLYFCDQLFLFFFLEILAGFEINGM